MIFGSTTFTSVQGHQSDEIETSGLIGNFNPSTGIQTTHWENQVSGGANIRRWNGITLDVGDITAPPHFAYDGTDDFLGEASDGYGGDPLQWDIGSAYTCCGWFQKAASGYLYPFSMKVSTSNRWYTQVQNDEDVRLWVEASNNDTFWTIDKFRDHEGLTAGRWFYFCVSHDGSGFWKVYLNGGILFTTKDTAPSSGSHTARDPSGTAPIHIGKRSYGTAYSDSGSKSGHLHLYNRQLKDSEIRQNFLASHDIYDARIYGRTYTA